MSIKVAMIGGSGLSQFPGFDSSHDQPLLTPYGQTSAAVVQGRLAGDLELLFLSRHGEGKTIPPHKVNYRANLWALKSLGVTHVVAVNAVGGLDVAMGPDHLVVPDQLIDYSYGREHSFYDGQDYDDQLIDSAGIEYADLTYPYSDSVRSALIAVLQASGYSYSAGAVYGCTQGPRLETAAEIRRLQADGCQLVGMTGMPEAALARELDLEYGALCLVVNWGAGMTERPADLAQIYQHLALGMKRVAGLTADIVEKLHKVEEI